MSTRRDRAWPAARRRRALAGPWLLSATRSRRGQRTEERKRVLRVAARVPAGRGPLLEVQVAGRRVAGLTDLADLLAGVHLVADADVDRAQVHVDVVLAGLAVVQDDVAPRRRLARDAADGHAGDGAQRRSAVGHDVLALVLAAAVAEAVAVVVGAVDGIRARGGRLRRRRGRPRAPRRP